MLVCLDLASDNHLKADRHSPSHRRNTERSDQELVRKEAAVTRSLPAAQYLQCVVLAGRHDAVALAQQAVDRALVGTQRCQAVAAYGVLPQALGTNIAQAVLSGMTWTRRVTHEVNLSALSDQLVKKLLPLNH